MILMGSLPDHLRPTLGTGKVNATLTGDMWLFVSTMGTNAIAARARAGLVAAAASTSCAACATPTALTSAGGACTAVLPRAVSEKSVQHLSSFLIYWSYLMTGR
jgi:hypothetical protein